MTFVFKYHRAYRRWGTGHKQRWQELELPVVPLSETFTARRTGQPRTLWLRGAARKQRETRRRGRWNIWVRFPVWWWWYSIFGARGWFSHQKTEVPAAEEVFASTAECVRSILLYLPCYETMGLPSRFVFNALFDIIYSFFDNDLSVMRLSVIGDFYRRSRYRDYSVRYSNNYFENF